MDPAVITRLKKEREVCCHSWGIPPWEFDAAMARGQITVDQIRICLELAWAMSPDKAEFGEWLFPGVTEEAKQHLEAKQMAATWAAFPFDE